MSNNELKNLKLLYVEDELSIRKYAMSYFNRIFDITFEAENASKALEIYKNEKPQIVITDIKMGDMSGIDLIKEIRLTDNKCQIIVLSAFLDTKYLLEAIELNLVKYLTKPIKHDKLYSVLVQCAKNLDNCKDLIYFSTDCFYNLDNQSLISNDKIIKLSQKESKLLELLCSNKTRIIGYQEIENKVWYDKEMSENALRILVKKLRKKLPEGSLENIPRVGYKIKIVK